MKASLTAQVLLHSEAAAMCTYIQFGSLPAEAEGTALFLEVNVV